MTDTKQQLAWNLFVEARKEILEYQKIRTQVVGFKITFVTAGVGLIVANSDKISTKLFLVPAFAAVLFDLLVTNYNFAIKRTGYYCRKHVEPIIRELYDWPSKYLLWEEFMRTSQAKQGLAQKGNLGITVIAIVPAIYTLLLPFPSVPLISWFMAILLLCFLVYDIIMYRLPKRYFMSDEKVEEQQVVEPDSQ